MIARLIRSTIPTLLACAVMACGGTSITQLTGPAAVRCQTSVTTPASSVPASGGTISVSVGAARECSWTASSEASWINVSPTTGQGDSSVVATVASNSQPATRSATVVVNDQRVTISQEAAPCRFDLNSASARVEPTGGNVSVSVATVPGCPWSAGVGEPWIHLLTTNGSGSGTVSMTVDRNTTSAARTATVTIADRPFAITQDAAAPAPVPGPSPAPTPSPTPAPSPSPSPTPQPPPVSCTYSIKPESASTGKGGGNGSFKLSTQDLCPWTTSSSAAWLTVTSSVVGVGPTTVTYTVQPWTDSSTAAKDQRTATITVGGQVFTVTQSK